METTTLKIGNKFIDFTLKDQNGEKITLSNFLGKRVLLSFHPLAWTSICEQQMKDLEKNYDEFLKFNTIPFGISVDPQPTKKAWAEHMKLKNLKILSDFWPHGDISKLYGVFRDKEGFSERANILINEKGDIIFIKIYELSKLPELIEIFDFLKSLK
ncbi:MAG: redoxin domain-containing protein [Caldisericia bacterium]|jgi:peroxiredoxin|nr:redoxin domain-containing protein [Caldisericia bacterium]